MLGGRGVASPSQAEFFRIHQALLLAQNADDFWMLAGTKGLSGLVAARPGG